MLTQVWPIISMLLAVVVGLIGVVYALQTGRISKLETWKNGRPSPTELMTKPEHVLICKLNRDELIKSINENVIIQIGALRDHIDLSIENVILKIGIRNSAER